MDSMIYMEVVCYLFCQVCFVKYVANSLCNDFTA